VANNQYVVSEIDGEKYCIEISKVKEIKRPKEITINELPNTPYSIDGIINLRGDVVPILNLRKKFKLEASKISKETRIIIAMVDSVLVGLLVDKIYTVDWINTSKLSEPLEMMKIDSHYISEIGSKDEDLFFVFDLEKLIS